MQVTAKRPLAPIEAPGAGGRRPLVIAHRGASRAAEPNSLAAFAAAIELGVDAIELDVRRTLDGVLVVHHDATVRGMPVARLSHAQLCRRRGRVPTLTEVADLCAGRVGLDVEIKQLGHERQIIEAVLKRVAPDQVVITSFLDPAVVAVKSVAPNVHCGLLLSPARLRARSQRAAFDWMRRSGADFIVAHQRLAPPVPVARRRVRPADPGLLPLAARAGIPVIVWTVNRPDRLRRYLGDARVAGVITDIPDVAIELRNTPETISGPPPAPVTRRTRHPFSGRVRSRLRG